MDWSALAAAVVPFAPTVGGLLGSAAFGPAGAVVGTIAGKALAGAFGVAATPAAVGAAIAQDPDAAAKLKKLEDEHAAALVQEAQVQIEALKQAGDTDRTNITEINATARQELGVVPWWHWRHLMGYSVLLQGTVIPLAILIFALKGNAEATRGATDTASALTIYFLTMAGLLGYVAQDTTRGKIVAATGAEPVTVTGSALGSLKALAARVTGR
jgi:hypothetical protein